MGVYMGEIVEYKCNNCGYKIEAWTGLGFLSLKSKNDKKFIEELIKMNDTEYFRDLLKNHIDEVKILESNEMYQCENCNALEKHKYIKIICHKQVGIINVYCKKCKIPMILVSKRGFANCPICKNVLDIIDMGSWD